MSIIVNTFRFCYAGACAFLNRLQSLLLLSIRLYWGWLFAQSGWSKLNSLDHVTRSFAAMNLPAPHATAALVATVEFAGGILLAAGLASRLVSLILFIDMTAAYLCVPKDRLNFMHMFSNPSDFYHAAPYTYWFAALLILILGPGLFALDTFIGLRYSRPARAVHGALKSVRSAFR
jgi:putative oxidoreductase